MEIMYLHIFVLCLLLKGKVSASVCEVALQCVTDLSEANCDAGQSLVPNSSIFGCCPSCGQPTGAGAGAAENTCAPPSSCLPDGRYAPVQCKGDLFTGRCFCYDEQGNRIFGQMWRDQMRNEEMTCACSRRRAELEASGRKTVSLHCTATGDYEPLQCDEGMCWCAEPKTGQPTAGPLLEEDMTVLPCYSASDIGAQYLRRCESLVQSLAMIHQEQSEHGTNFLGITETFCDYDGSYGPFQVISGGAYCTNRNGEILGAWQAPINSVGTMDCNCARDSVMYFPERGMTLTETCLGNGSYQREQSAGGVDYCVDSDGYTIDC